MKFDALWEVATGGRVRATRALLTSMTEHTRACFLVAAAQSGVLRALARESRSVSELAAACSIPPVGTQRFESWLDVGVALDEIRRSGDRVELAGSLAHALAHDENDDMLAMLQEVVDLHRRLVVETPERIASGRPFTLSDQSGDVVARSSRMLEPFVKSAIREAVPESGACRVLEVGCGSGTYVRYMLERNPECTVTGLELQPDVRAQAIGNLHTWGLDARARIEVGDIRAFESGSSYDVVTLHNNIYYFTESERVATLAKVRELLDEAGVILLTTSTRGGSPSAAVLSLWGAMTEGCGPLPTPEEMLEVLREAGFVRARAVNLAGPFERYFAFVGER